MVVYQMGKVGSSTIARALGAPQVHTLDPRVWLQSAWAGGLHRHHLNAVRMRIAMPRRVVTGVREPVARNLSAFMQNHEAHRWSAEAATFLAEYNHDRPLEWFDREVQRHLGIDVYRHPFPHERGWQIVEGRLLILRAEAADAQKEEGLSEFLGRDVTLPARENVGAEKSYADAYAALKDSILLPEAYLDRMYDSRYARHFYTETEITRFRAFWSAD